MRKEVIFAIIVGLILGLVILYGIQLANQSAKQATTTSISSTQEETISPTPAQTANLELMITSPQNHAVVNTSSVEIVGKTIANSSLAISDSEDDTLTNADKDGNFTANLKLTGGANTINITSLKPDLTTVATKITIIYTTAKIDQSSYILDPITASPSAIVDETKRKAIEAALDKNLKSTQGALEDSVNRSLLVGYAGVISDIKQGVFNLTTDETNLQVSYNPETTILKDGRTLKPELLSVKDKTIVIGNMSSPDILIAKRIVISSKDEGPKIEKKVIFSSVMKIKSNILTLNIDGKNQDVVIGKKLKLDPRTLTASNKIFGILLIGTDGSITLLQAKVIPLDK